MFLCMDSHYKIKERCELWNGYVAEPGQFCHCEWMGYVYDDFKGPDQPTTLEETPSTKLTKSLSTFVEAFPSAVGKTSTVDATSTPEITVAPPVNTEDSTLNWVTSSPVATATSQ